MYRAIFEEIQLCYSYLLKRSLSYHKVTDVEMSGFLFVPNMLMSHSGGSLALSAVTASVTVGTVLYAQHHLYRTRVCITSAKAALGTSVADTL